MLPKLRLVDFDSNLTDYIAFRWDRCFDRTLKHKAIRGLSTVQVLADHALQYLEVFPQYIEQFEREWKPVLNIGMVTEWNETCQGWQTKCLDDDRYSKGFPGEDGKLYRGFIESGMMYDGEGEAKSRYEGVVELFGEI